MLKSEIKPKTEYALREKRVPGAPFQRVRILEHIRGNKWKAEWVDPNSGLVHFVESGHLICPWRDHKAFLKEEDARERLREHNYRCGYDEQSPLTTAIGEVLGSLGDDVDFYRGVVRASPEALERVKTRAGMDPAKRSPVAYVDRQGRLHLPFDDALELARKFSAAEPATVLTGLEATERKWAQGASRPGEEYMAGLLNEYRAAWALVRQWAGHDAAVAAREAQITRLERLVWDAVYALQKAGLDTDAARLRRVLERR